MGTIKNLAKNLPAGSVVKRKTKKGSSTTPKAKTKRSTPRFFDVKIRITAEEFERGKPYFQEQKYLAKFVLDSFREKLNRAETNNKTARVRKMAEDIKLLETLLKEMYSQGKLGFLGVARQGAIDD